MQCRAMGESANPVICMLLNRMHPEIAANPVAIFISTQMPATTAAHHHQKQDHNEGEAMELYRPCEPRHGHEDCQHKVITSLRHIDGKRSRKSDCRKQNTENEWQSPLSILFKTYLPAVMLAKRKQGGCGDDEYRMLPNPIERDGRDQCGEQAAQHTASGHDQVKECQARWVGPQIVEFAVQSDGNHKQHDQRCEGYGESSSRTCHHSKSADQQDNEWRDPRYGIRDCTIFGKGRYVAQQVEAERHDPKKWHRKDVGCEMRCGRKHEA